jgi:hypothetical protein
MMLKKTLLLLSLCLVCTGSVLAKPIDQQYSGWDALTKKHVHWLADQSQSRTDYAGLKADHAQLAQVLAELSAVTQAEFDSWPQDQQKAFLINAYNAFTVELILTQYPDLKSIKELGSFFQSPWKKKFFTLLGSEHHLDWIENDMLRPRYQDPRIHVGINCASIGCPGLRNEAYTGAKLDAQLDDSMLRFLADKTRNRYRDGKLEVSAIFKWFAEDFEKGHKGFKQVNDVFARYAAQLSTDASVQAAIRSKSVPLTYLSYDWALNDIARGAR